MVHGMQLTEHEQAMWDDAVLGAEVTGMERQAILDALDRVHEQLDAQHREVTGQLHRMEGQLGTLHAKALAMEDRLERMEGHLLEVIKLARDQAANVADGLQRLGAGQNWLISKAQPLLALADQLTKRPSTGGLIGMLGGRRRPAGADEQDVTGSGGVTTETDDVGRPSFDDIMRDVLSAPAADVDADADEPLSDHLARQRMLNMAAKAKADEG